MSNDIAIAQFNLLHDAKKKKVFIWKKNNWMHMQGAQLLEENKQLKQKVREKNIGVFIWLFQFKFEKLRKEGVVQMEVLCKGKRVAFMESDTGAVIQEEGLSSESATNNICSCSSGPPLEEDSSDTSLKLG